MIRLRTRGRLGCDNDGEHVGVDAGASPPCQRTRSMAVRKAKVEKKKPVEAKEAAKKADVIMILTQDHIQADLYRKSLKRYLKKGKSIAFSHGFNIHFGQIKPAEDIDVWPTFVTVGAHRS